LDARRKVLEDPIEKTKIYSSKVSKSTPKVKASSSIEELRKKRLERELEERTRTQQVLNPNHKSKHEAEKSYYNSQYNRDFVRKPHGN
jgi:hypothetical protein